MIGSFERVLHVLEEAQVRYMVVGGVAVVLHGHLRATADIDVLLDFEPTNTRKAVEAFRSAGFKPRAPVPLESFADTESRRRLAIDKGMVVFSLWHPDIRGLEVDLFIEEPKQMADAWDRRLQVTVGEITVSIPSLADLIRMKRAVARPQDLADVAALETLLEAGDE